MVAQVGIFPCTAGNQGLIPTYLGRQRLGGHKAFCQYYSHMSLRINGASVENELGYFCGVTEINVTWTIVE
jgi:hypothetical protein